KAFSWRRLSFREWKTSRVYNRGCLTSTLSAPMASSSEQSGYLPGDPRYGLSGDALRNYYRQKPAQWVILAWDAAGKAGARASNIDAQKDYARTLSKRLIV